MTGQSCGKTRYTSGAQARAALDGIRRRGQKRDETPSRAYPCETCHGWHLTHDGVGNDRFTTRKRRRGRPLHKRKNRRTENR